MGKRKHRAPPKRLILDSGAVIALARADGRARAALTAALEADAVVSIPAVVLAETVRGRAADAPVNRVVKAVGDVDVLDAAVGRIAGDLLGQRGSNATVDAIVVATAIEVGGAAILTGDPGDLGSLAVEHDAVVVQPL